ncbi:hypothetical protein [Parapedobacter sp. DT-150]|uniref:hypothetical protein n=1 Tax=Parapedobacter sp. DT-150 TaxID=3396162 RepID=UPI003F1D2280
MKPLWKWTIGVSAGLIIIALVTNWSINHQWKPKIAAKLRDFVANETDGRYRLTYDRLTISLFAGNVTATNLRLTADTAAFTRLKGQQTAPKTLYEIRIGRLQVRGVGMLRLLLSNEMRMNTLLIDSPSVKLTRLQPVEDDAAADTGMSLIGFSDRLKGTRVNRIVLNGGLLELTDNTDATHVQVRDVNAEIRHVRIDSAALRDTTRLLFAKAMLLEADSLDVIRADSLYHLHVGPLRLDTDTRELALRNLRYALTVSKTEFYRRMQRAKDISDISIARIGLTGIDIAQWVKAGTIAAAVLRIDTGAIAIYKDKTQPDPPENKIGESPHQRLLQWKQPLAIDSVGFSGLDIRFTEVSDKTGKAGTVMFEATNGIIRNVTNDSLALARNRFMLLDVRSKVMGAGNLAVAFRFDLLDSLGGHTYKGTLGPMEGQHFNGMLTPHLNVEIERAAIDALRFDMAADDRRTSGTLQLDYHDLTLNMLSDGDNGRRSTKKLASFLANRFLVNDSNPDANGIYHTGTVYIPRPRDFSFFKMIWRSIREGTKQCLGMENGDG